MSETVRKRRWFQFSLRTLLIAVTTLGVIAGWYAYHRDWIRQRHAFLDEMANRDLKRQASGGWNNDFNVNSWTEFPYVPTIYFAVNRRKAPWSLRLLGEERHSSIVLAYGENEDQGDRLAEIWREIDHAARLFPEADVYPICMGRWIPPGSFTFGYPDPHTVQPLP